MTAPQGPSRVSRRASTKTKEARRQKRLNYLRNFRNGAGVIARITK